MSTLAALVTMALVGVALAAGRPQHYLDNANQGLFDDGMPLSRPAAMAHLELGLWQLLADAREYARLRGARPSEERRGEVDAGAQPVKRQGKRLKCYFNPVSCF